MALKATDPVLARVREDEPIFVLRAQDATAPDAVRLWAENAAEHLGWDHPKIVEALRCADAMAVWGSANGSKLPD